MSKTLKPFQQTEDHQQPAKETTVYEQSMTTDTYSARKAKDMENNIKLKLLEIRSHRSVTLKGSIKSILLEQYSMKLQQQKFH